MNGGTLQLSVFLIALAVSFFMSGFEAGVFALNRLRIRQLMREGNASARLLHRYLERSENFLWTIFLGNTLSNFVAVTLFAIPLRNAVGDQPWLFWTAFVAGTFSLYIVGELLPKNLFRKFPNRLCLRLVRPFQLLHFLLSPAVGIVERFARLLLRWTGGAAYTGSLFANREEFRQLIRERGDALSGTERRLINRVLDLQNVTVAHIARPLHGAGTVEADTPVSEVLEQCRTRNLTRLPVYSGTGPMRRIVGIINLKTLLYSEEIRPNSRARDLLRPALFLDESTRLEDALRRLQRSGHHFAIVMGADRREHGLITLWDILRAVFGDAASARAAAREDSR